MDTYMQLMVVIGCLATLGSTQLNEDELIKTKANGMPEITSPPRITQEPQQEIAYKDDEEVKLPCVSSGDPRPEYRWYKDGQLLEEARFTDLGIKKTLGMGTLVIEKPNQDHEGIYQCFADNTYGTALSVKSQLKQAKLIPFETVTEPFPHYPKLGEYLKLECTPPYSYPTGLTYWGENKQGTTFKAIATDERIAMDYQGSLHFANVEAIDDLGGKDYVCIVQNEKLRVLVQGDDQRVFPRSAGRITQIKPKLKWNSESPTIAVAKTTKKMKCIFSGNPTPRVHWTMENGDPLPSKVTVSKTGHEIVIPNIDYGDEAGYKCAAENSRSDPKSDWVYKVLQLRVQSMPDWVVKPESVDTSEEEDAEFRCEAGGIPRPEISWSINGEPIENQPNARREIMNGGQLIKYTEVTKTDAAVLQCNASNSHGYIFYNAYLNVIAEPPTFISKPQSVVKVAEGQDTTIACEVYGAPKPVVTWKKDEEDVDGPRFSISTSGKIVGNLTIQRAVKADEGIYECFAKNKFGEIDANGQLIVREKTEIIVFPKSQEVHAGEKVVLECEAQTDANEVNKLVIYWKRNGERIDFDSPDTSSTLSFDTRDNSLTISGAAVDDTASYTCVASNGLDQDEFTAEIVVKDRPEPPYDVFVPTCGAEKAEVEWIAGFDNNDAVTEFIVYYNMSFDDPGIFHEAKKVPSGQANAVIGLSPWTNYTFHVKARNSIGLSESSGFTTAMCQTSENIPFKSPSGVCTESREPDQLVVVWDPMPKIEHNGQGFKYVVSYEEDRAGASPFSMDVTDWKEGELVIPNQATFTKYKISVEAKNNFGSAPSQNLEVHYGYSGEDVPTVSLQDFAIVEDSITATNATFMWQPVDVNDPGINGFFRGYKIVYWISGTDEKRYKEDIVHEFDPCPLVASSNNNRGKRQSVYDYSDPDVNMDVTDLWPYSTITAGVMVLNGGKEGVMSDTIEFQTPEGAPGYVNDVQITETGSYHLKVEWEMPDQPNGIITGYSVGHKILGSTHKVKEEFVGMSLSKKIKKLTPETDYAVTVWAHTVAGPGEHYVVEEATVAAMPPDEPTVSGIEYLDDTVKVTVDMSKDKPAKNPGSDFYVKYRKKGEEDWEKVYPEEDNNWVNVTDLDKGELYELVIVAVNGQGENTEETESEPKEFTPGGPIEGVPMSTEEPISGERVGPVKTNLASAGWFIALMCAIIFLLLILLIVCLIRRNRGGKYPVYEKEKLRGKNPEDEEENFGEYNNKQPYMPLETKGDEPRSYAAPPKNLPPNNIDDEQPLGGSESDSMAEYEDTDPTKFNEDGSFIGLYGGKRDSTIQPDGQPNALSTFV